MARRAAKVTGVYEKNPGSGVWYVRYRVAGKLVRKKIGNKEHAKDYLAKAVYVRSTGDGELPTTAKRPVRTIKEMDQSLATITVGELCDDFLEHVVKNPRDYRDARNPPIRVAAIRKAFGERIAAGVRPKEVSCWLSSLKKRTRGIRNGESRQTTEPISAGTQNRLKSTFSSIYQLAKHNEKVAVNPIREVKQAKVGSGVVRFMSPAEEKRLRKVLEAKVDACTDKQPILRQQALHRIYELDVALGTGMRKSEQYGLKWTDVDFEREVVTLQETKNGSAREVHLIKDVLDALRALHKMDYSSDPAREGYVFRNGENKKWWLAALKEAKIENLRWHDLRHTFCSRLAQSGANLKVIQEAAGHKSIQMSARYAHLDKTTMRNAMAVLNRR